ncbi:hypothetical protein Ciccas_000720 [Cichlidogyrus casuarinus]|uniref:Uncharacterized protein n=1 Tax=Cichlidogyrus casuarinus TaxID=1844966 RepID=A0ABD2QM52_9PLAT
MMRDSERDSELTFACAMKTAHEAEALSGVDKGGESWGNYHIFLPVACLYTTRLITCNDSISMYMYIYLHFLTFAARTAEPIPDHHLPLLARLIFQTRVDTAPLPLLAFANLLKQID